jgi:LysM repeat protein
MSSVLTTDLTKDVRRLQEDVAKLKEELQQANATLKANEEQIETSTTAKERESNELRQGQDQSNLKLQQAEATLQAKEQEINQLHQEKDQLNLELQQAKAALQAKDEEVEDLATESAHKDETIQELNSEFDKVTKNVDKLATFGLMALEQGWYSQAHRDFEQALKTLRSTAGATVEPIQDRLVEPPHKVKWKQSITQEGVKGQWRLGKMAILACIPFFLLLGFCVGLVSTVRPTSEATPTPAKATQTQTTVTATPTPIPPTATLIPTSPTLVPPTATPVIYVVRAGDTLTTIAEKFGVTVEALQEANAISDPRRLQIGQELIIPIAVAPGP